MSSLITDDNDYLPFLTGKHAAGIKKVRLDFNADYFNKTGMEEAYSVKYPQGAGFKN